MQFSISTRFKHTVKCKNSSFQTIQFSVITQCSSIRPIDRTLLCAITPDQSEIGSDGNVGIICIPQSSNINGASPSYCLVSYTGHSLGESYPLLRCSRCILSPQLTGIVFDSNTWNHISVCKKKKTQKKKKTPATQKCNFISTIIGKTWGIKNIMRFLWINAIKMLHMEP